LLLSTFFAYIFFYCFGIIIPKILVIYASIFVLVSVDSSASFKTGVDWKIGGGPDDLWFSVGIL
jgi:hypothetical protein